MKRRTPYPAQNTLSNGQQRHPFHLFASETWITATGTSRSWRDNTNPVSAQFYKGQADQCQCPLSAHHPWYSIPNCIQSAQLVRPRYCKPGLTLPKYTLWMTSRNGVTWWTEEKIQRFVQSLPEEMQTSPFVLADLWPMTAQDSEGPFGMGWKQSLHSQQEVHTVTQTISCLPLRLPCVSRSPQLPRWLH